MDPFDSILDKIAVRGTDDAEKNSLLERYRAWLATADPDAARAVAARAAVRFVTSPRGLDGIDEQDTIALATLRCALTACVASIVPGNKVVRDAATEAAAKYDKIVGYIRSRTSNERSYSAGRTGVLVSFAACAACARDDHAEYALRAMYYLPRSTNAVSYAATDQDIFDVEEGSAELFKSSLWQGFEDDLLTGHMISGEYWSDAPKNWAFWERWYDGMLAGQPLPWELQRDVALIEDEVWEAGADAVAEKIAEIEGDYRTRVAPRLVRDDSAGKFRVEDDPLPPAETAEFVCQTIEVSLRTALEGSGANGFDENSPEAIQIRGTLDAPTKSVSVLAVGFYQACLMFNDRIGDIYPRDASLINLKNVLWTATEELSELDPEARARCARLAALQPKREVDPPDREMIAKVPEIVSDDLDAEAREIVESDVERILTERKPSKFVRARFTNWMSTISNWMDKGMKADKRAKWLSDLVSRLRDWWSDMPES